VSATSLSLTSTSAGACSSVTSSSVIWIVSPSFAISAKNRRNTGAEKGGPPTAVR